MKTARMIICLLTVVFVALIASPSFAQQFPEPYHTQIAEIAKKRAADQDDIYWGWGIGASGLIISLIMKNMGGRFIRPRRFTSGWMTLGRHLRKPRKRSPATTLKEQKSFWTLAKK